MSEDMFDRKRFQHVIDFAEAIGFRFVDIETYEHIAEKYRPLFADASGTEIRARIVQTDKVNLPLAAEMLMEVAPDKASGLMSEAISKQGT